MHLHYDQTKNLSLEEVTQLFDGQKEWNQSIVHSGDMPKSESTLPESINYGSVSKDEK